MKMHLTLGKLTHFLLWISFFSKEIFCMDLDVDDVATIKNATYLYARGALSYYVGDRYGDTIGLFSWPYYWWHAGAVWGSLIDYWHFTGDDEWNNLTMTAMLYQTGDNWDYMPENQTVTEGNDDQAFWGIAAMGAAERNFTNPKSNQPQWLYLAQAVFNTMSERWDNSTCGGGLRWQIFSFNNGYNYKNSVSNAALFHLAARLARYTGNESYVDWAEKTWDWMESIKLLDIDTLAVYDGSDTDINCTTVNHLQWSYNAGLIISGAAYLYNFTESDTWKDRTDLAWSNSKKVFFKNNTMTEYACEGVGTCNTDQRIFKAIFSRFIGLTAVLCRWLNDDILFYLRISAMGAAQSCTGPSDYITCGISWNWTGYDGTWGLGQEVSALEVTQNLMINMAAPPYTAFNGATSNGSYTAGTSSLNSLGVTLSPSTTGDRAGAGVVTAVVLIVMLAGCWWVII